MGAQLGDKLLDYLLRRLSQLFPNLLQTTKKPRQLLACPYPKLKRPSSPVSGRAFLCGCLSNWPLFKWVQPARNGLVLTLREVGKDLGKDKPATGGAFCFLSGLGYLLRDGGAFGAALAEDNQLGVALEAQPAIVLGGRALIGLGLIRMLIWELSPLNTSV